MPQVFIPPALRPLVDGQDSVAAEGGSVGEVLEDLERRFPGVRQRLCQGDALRPGMTVVIGGAVSTLGVLQRVAPDTEIHFLPAIGGG